MRATNFFSRFPIKTLNVSTAPGPTMQLLVLPISSMFPHFKWNSHNVPLQPPSSGGLFHPETRPTRNSAIFIHEMMIRVISVGI
jgi:hypothetical protein